MAQAFRTIAPVAFRADRWSQKSPEEFRALKRKKSDATIQKHVVILEKLAANHGGYVPSFKWLDEHGYFASYQTMRDYPAAFAHLKMEADKKFEIYQSHNSSTPVVLAPIKTTRTLAEYNVPGACFNPTELVLQEGLTEKEWMTVGRAIAHIGESARWWVGDLLLYGFKTYGKKVAFDLAQQATGVSRGWLHGAVYVAKRFPPERRVAALSFYHHGIVARFQPELADRLLAEAAENGFTARQIRALAEEEIGEKKPEKNRVILYLLDETYHQLLERANGRPLEFVIAQMIVEGLSKPEAA